MSDVHTTAPAPVLSPRRAERPEKIDIGTDVLVRNDILAKEQGASERTLNRADAEGAPFIKIAGVKYRPLRQYQKFLAAQIVVRGQPPVRPPVRRRQPRR